MLITKLTFLFPSPLLAFFFAPFIYLPQSLSIHSFHQMLFVTISLFVWLFHSSFPLLFLMPCSSFAVPTTCLLALFQHRGPGVPVALCPWYGPTFSICCNAFVLFFQICSLVFLCILPFYICLLLLNKGKQGKRFCKA